uniref:Ankyrin repeat and zinc finger domain-containing protein 1 n=1 Tax=Schistosoma japonicum TaxID=6182 RepID=C1LDR4_SCHJA|nr:Ankyrin repeat and zinc finger domain-containing protein 1 [Schistosoma japonicum]
MSSNVNLISRQCKRTCDRYQFFDQKIAVEKLTGLVLVGEAFSNNNSGNSVDTSIINTLANNYISSLQKFYCNICRVKMVNAMDMREHFKSEWHICNMNRSLRGHCPLDFDLFKTLRQDENENASEMHEIDRINLPLSLIEPNVDNSDCDQNTSSNTVTVSSLTASSHKHMLFFRNYNSEIIGINRCVLFSRKTMPVTMDELLASVSRVRQSRRWAILLYSGGKFAGGIFDGTNEIVHKTLHCYTVRAKQGGGQSSYDSQCGGLSGAKSAGSNLRRHGEATIRSEISDLLHNKWRVLLQSCQLIFLWSPKVHRGIFFNPPVSSTSASSSNKFTSDNLNISTDYSSVNSSSQIPSSLVPDSFASQACDCRLGMTIDDPRLRRIPCRSKRITYLHVKELHKELSTFDVYDPDANLEFLSKSGRNQWRKLSESGDETLLETKSGRLIYGPLSLLTSSSTSPKKNLLSSSSDTSDVSDCVSSHDDDYDYNDVNKVINSENNLQKTSETVGTSSLSQPSPSSLPMDYESNNVKEIIDNFEDLCVTYQSWHRRLRVAVASGDLVTLRSLLPMDSSDKSQSDNLKESETIVHSSTAFVNATTTTTSTSTIECTSPGSTVPPYHVCLKLINHPLIDGRTLLHVAVEFQSDPELIHLLLEYGCDPAISDGDSITPYQLATRLHKKVIANVFRRFRFHYADRYDYEKAQIPAPLDPSKEAAKAERERERAKRQRQRQKEKRAAEREAIERQKKDAEEQARFLALSDREKRAIATERRLLATSTEAGEPFMVFSRCFQCGCDISGKVPFTYLDYNFCTPNCLKQHRLTSTIIKK